MFRRRALWFLALLALVVLSGPSMYQDDRPHGITRPGFTVFAVDQGGEQTALARFDGQTWRSPCDIGQAALRGSGSADPPARGGDRPRPEGSSSQLTGDGGAATAGPRPDPSESVPLTQIAGLAGSPGAPLLRVRELTGDSVGWEPTADVVEAKAVSEAGFAGPRHTDPAVYSADSAGTGVAYVEVLIRDREPAFRGLVASAWVWADETPAQIIDFRMTPFGSYQEYVSTERQIPLGVVDEGDERVWVMGVRGTAREDVRLVSVTAREARERLRVVRGGC